MKNVFAICGLLAGFLFIGGDLLGVALWKGYKILFQSISELTATGAPTRPVVLPIFLLSHLLLVAFGFAIWEAAGENAGMKVLSVLVIGNGLSSVIAALFPMTLGRTARLSDPGAALGAISVVLMVAALIVAAIATDGWVRWLSIGVVAAFAALTVVGLTLQATPHIGLQERVMSYGWLIWVGIVAIALLRSELSSGGAFRPLAT